MAAGIRGRLITATFADVLLPTLPGATSPPDTLAASLDVWGDTRERLIGPASSARTIADVVLLPLMKLLGFDGAARTDGNGTCLVHLRAPGVSLPAIVVGWDEPLRRAWRSAVFGAVSADARWACCCNGRALRLVDAQHTWTREHLEIDLDLLAHDAATQRVLWSLLRAEAFAASPPLLEAAAARSARHGIDVCRALGDGVLEALRHLLEALTHGRARPADAFEQSLTVLYRVLFLLFAEARGLVPMWHPVYRERYTIDAIVSTLLAGRRYRGVWQAIDAISRLAHAGCTAGELTVTAFNGRLFAPAHSAAFDRARLDDRVMEQAVLAVSTTPVHDGRARIAYRDLDVEQLGAVYEQVLDCDGDARKSTGTFYTPRAVTDHLVRCTLDPLTAGRGSRDILALRVVDPAMGSGAFLVAVCRYLAEAVEEARIREGVWHPADVTTADRAQLRREIAQQCLFGADLNPMAVQLARLSIWLATLAADKPLTFLDHHLIAGDSLVGATPDDVRRQPSRGGTARRQSPLPLFEDEWLAPVLEHAVRARLQLAAEPDEAAATVHRKEQALAALHARNTPLGAWGRVLDLWCAGWFRDDGHAPDAGAFGELSRAVLGGSCALPDHLASELLARADAVAARHRFLHWPLAFPEVFADEHGAPHGNPGFDAVIGNPPWDMVRGDSGAADVREGRRDAARRLTDFVREAGIYRVESRSHVNRYQLFLERALQLTRRGGRLGLVLPSGLVTDSGTAALRRHLFSRADVDTLTGLGNRYGIFPIHRSVRFVLLTGTTGQETSRIACRFGVSHVDELDATVPPARAPLVLTRRFLARLSGEDDMGIPGLTSMDDLRIVEKIAAAIPWLGSPAGWEVHFGRELNATDDRAAFAPYRGSAWARPVLEGKQIEPFRAFPEAARFELPAAHAASGGVLRRARLAYRDVASATNRLTLIAAIVPARCVTTHTLFCLKTPLALHTQHVLCALLNSFVANYLIRLRVNTHVTASLMSRLPVPLVAPKDPAFTRLATLARTLASASVPAEEHEDYITLQATVARLYRLSAAELEHVLGTFPLIAADIRSRTLALFSNLH